ncbi:MAG: hypothetical protein JXO72_02530 [Vicinamibacteria bacterium]|nr:hypothetical protein [Vicinamibacteria bacterium]
MIRSSVDRGKGITVHTCTGKLTAQDILDEIKSFYEGDPTPCDIWDFEQADASGVTAADVECISRIAQSYLPLSWIGRTALVSTGSLTYGLSRMYEAYAEIASTGVEVRVFKTSAEAESWLAQEAVAVRSTLRRDRDASA